MTAPAYTIPTCCPHCGDARIVYKSKKGEWECENCEERFPGGAPAMTEEPIIRHLSDKAANPKAIFFSYGHDDNRELVRLFRADLEKRGHQIWFDEKDIGVWDDWKGKITKGIDSSHMAVAFISMHSIRDPGVCQNEIAIAMNRFGAVYPVLLEAGIEQDIPVTVRHLQWPDLSQWRAIRGGTVPGVEWAPWYQEKLYNLIEKIEGEATRFANETRVLQKTLQPSTSESKIAQHVPRFVGREWIFDAYAKWLDHQPDSRLFWIKAGPGVGKTAIAANLAHRQRSAICASWFCDAKSSNLRDPSSALRSIAYQLALRMDDYRSRLLTKLQLFEGSGDNLCEEARKELGKKNIQDLFLFLLAEPLSGLIWREHKLVVVIDALDEATDDKGNNGITDLISNELNSLPNWICFVVTSRPDAEVVNRLGGFNPFEINAADPRNLEDLRSWYRGQLGQRKELTGLPEVEQQRIEDLLIGHSEGMILYLKVIEEGFKEGSLMVDNLDNLQSGLAGLYRRYYDSFQQRFGKDYDESVKPLLRLLVAAGSPLQENLASETLGWNSEQFLACRNRLGSYVIEVGNCYEVFHKTLAEWLYDKFSGSFHLDRQVGRQMLANVLFREIGNKESHLVRWKKPIKEWLPDWLSLLAQNDDPDSLDKLGSILHEWADYSRARFILEHALAIREKKLGPEHPSIAKNFNKLASTYRSMGDYSAAESFIRHALSISEKTLGSEHTETATILDNLAGLLRTKGDYKVAEPFQRRALLIAEKTLGGEHAETGSMLNNLALLLRYECNYEAAEPLQRRALAIAEKTLGPEHPDTGVALDNYAVLLKNLGDYSAAEPLQRRALEIAEKTRGPDHPTTCTALNNLGLLLTCMGDCKAAEQLLRRALLSAEKTLGPEHPRTDTFLNNLARLLEDIYDYKSAELLQRRALTITEKILGANHQKTLANLINLGRLLMCMEDFASATLVYRRALDIVEHKKGKNHSDLIPILGNLAGLSEKVGDIGAMEEFRRRQFEILGA